MMVRFLIVPLAIAALSGCSYARPSMVEPHVWSSSYRACMIANGYPSGETYSLFPGLTADKQCGQEADAAVDRRVKEISKEYDAHLQAEYKKYGGERNYVAHVREEMGLPPPRVDLACQWLPTSTPQFELQTLSLRGCFN